MITNPHRSTQKPEGGLEFMLWLAQEAAARRGKLAAAPRESKHAAGRTRNHNAQARKDRRREIAKKSIRRNRWMQ